MIFDRDVTFEHAGNLGLECRIAMQARDFVFIFVSHELKQIAGHRLGQTQRLRRSNDFALGRADLIDEGTIGLRIRCVLVRGEKITATRN